MRDVSPIQRITHLQVEGQQIPAEFTYSVTWRETTVPFEKRMDKYRRYQFLPQHLEARTHISAAEPWPCLR